MLDKIKALEKRVKELENLIHKIKKDLLRRIRIK
tara:strand:- start:6508 stop:6609 length:102 start_codon:yes stop_codon:yes gene_type:complete